MGRWGGEFEADDIYIPCGDPYRECAMSYPEVEFGVGVLALNRHDTSPRLPWGDGQEHGECPCPIPVEGMGGAWRCECADVCGAWDTLGAWEIGSRRVRCVLPRHGCDDPCHAAKRGALDRRDPFPLLTVGLRCACGAAVARPAGWDWGPGRYVDGRRRFDFGEHLAGAAVDLAAAAAAGLLTCAACAP